MSRRSVFTARERQAMFDELVAHPYGMAAMELWFQRSNALWLRRYSDERKNGSMLRRSIDAMWLRDEVEKARARARGRA